MSYRYTLAALALLATPATFAQSVDCNNLPDLNTAEPPEFAVCHPPLVVENTTPSFGAAPSFAMNVRASGIGQGYITYDASNPAGAVLLAADTDTYFAADFAGDSFTEIYAVSFGAAIAPSLYRINTATAVETLVGSTGLPIGTNVSGMAWDYTTSTMYATVTATTGTLYAVNTTTGAMTLVAPITGTLTTPINLMAHPTTGVLYSVDNTLDDLFSIDKATGASTSIGDIGYAISFAQGADFDNATNVAYMCAYQGGGVNTLRTLNLATGASTSVGSFNQAEVDMCASMTARTATASEGAPRVGMNVSAQPNPFTQQSQLLVSVAEAQQVRVEVYDVMGRLVTTLFDGQVNALSPTVVTLDAANLRPGVYVVRAVGERSVQTTQVTVAR